MHLAGSEHAPARLVVTDTATDRLETLRAVLGDLGPRTDVRLELVGSAGDSDRLL